MDTSSSHDSSPNYPTLFRDYVGQSTSDALAQVRRTPAAHAERTRQQALHILSYALKLPSAWPVACDLLLALAPQMEQAGYREGWIDYLARGLVISRTVQDVVAEGELQYHIGVLYQRQGHYEAARTALEASATIFEQQGDRQREGRAVNQQAYLAFLEREVDSATRLADEGYHLVRGNPAEEAYSLLVKGCIAQREQAWTTSRDLLEQALERATQGGSDRLIAWVLTNLGVTLRGMGQYEAARDSYQRAIQRLEVVEDPTHLATARMNLANVLLTLGLYAEALHEFGLAEPIFRQTEDRLRLASLHNNRGICYREMGHWTPAEEEYLSSIRYWATLDDPVSLANVEDGLGLVYLAQGKRPAARDRFEQAFDRLDKSPPDPERDELIQTVRAHLARVSEGDE